MSEHSTYIGIDEAGYGPNLGPLVMTAVAITGPADRPPDVWRDLAPHVGRAGENSASIWIDDSKAVLARPGGFARLEGAVLALAGGLDGVIGPPRDVESLARWFGVPTLAAMELDRWIVSTPPVIPRWVETETLARFVAARVFEGAFWRVTAVRALVIGPAQFNTILGQNSSKAAVNFDAFARLLGHFWNEETATDLRVVVDKHGGRNYYLEPLHAYWPDTWIERGVEGRGSSAYVLKSGQRRLSLEFRARADQSDGLVALASMVSKYLRERWMEAFNEYWRGVVPGVAPTAGYPTDAARFRAAIETHARRLRLPGEHWWRER